MISPNYQVTIQLNYQVMISLTMPIHGLNMRENILHANPVISIGQRSISMTNRLYGKQKSQIVSLSSFTIVLTLKYISDMGANNRLIAIWRMLPTKQYKLKYCVPTLHSSSINMSKRLYNLATRQSHTALFQAKVRQARVSKSIFMEN